MKKGKQPSAPSIGGAKKHKAPGGPTGPMGADLAGLLGMMGQGGPPGPVGPGAVTPDTAGGSIPMGPPGGGYSGGTAGGEGKRSFPPKTSRGKPGRAP